jgi:hypothetical protein
MFSTFVSFLPLLVFRESSTPLLCLVCRLALGKKTSNCDEGNPILFFLAAYPYQEFPDPVWLCMALCAADLGRIHFSDESPPAVFLT